MILFYCGHAENIIIVAITRYIVRRVLLQYHFDLQ